MEFKFLCLNLWQGGNLFDGLLEFVRQENPDILALQEVYDGKNPNWERKYRSMEILRQELGYPYEAFAPTFLEVKEFGKIEQGNAILSRFPIVHAASIFFDQPYGERMEIPSQFATSPRNLQHADIQLPTDIQLSVFNTQGIWGTDGRDTERRLKMGQQIADAVKDKSNVILTGDFNVNPDTQTIGCIERHMRNVFKGELKTTFNTKQKKDPVFAGIIVDMLFVSSEINVLEHSCPQVDVSDHLPLLAKLSVE